MIFVHLQLRKKDYYKKVEKIEVRKVRFLNTIVVTLIVLGFFMSMLTSLDISRIKKQWNREYVVQEFGIYTYQGNDLISYIRTKVNSMFGKFLQSFAFQSRLLERDFSRRLEEIEEEMKQERIKQSKKDKEEK